MIFSILKKVFFYSFSIIFIICAILACASIGNPQGGPLDERAPQMISSNPKPDALNFQGKRVEILFDELVQLEKPSEKIIITPPQKNTPLMRAMGKKVRIEFQDSLLPNTTYTIDFTDAIVDNNEKNPLENFSFAFSTGESLDSLIISGILLNAENLEPMPNILIGLHNNLDDSAFITEPFIRTTKTNDKGRFWIRNVSYGTYHIFALNDLNRNYIFDQPGEEIAFLDSLIVPNFEPAVLFDTIWADSITVDSIYHIHYNRFFPDNLELFLFMENFQRQYLVKSERTDPKKFSLYFNEPKTAEPIIQLLKKETDEDWYIPEISEDGLVYNYWITQPHIYEIDTLMVKVEYFKTDSLNNYALSTDTIRILNRQSQKNKNKNKNKKEEDEKIEFMNISFSSQSLIEVYDTVKFSFSEPLAEFNPELIRIEQKVDTLWEIRNFDFIQDTLNPRTYYIDNKWKYGLEYQISIDSSAFFSIYDKWNDKIKVQFKVRKEEEYGHLYVNIAGIEGNGIGELLDGSDKIVKRVVRKNNELLFFDLKPGKYYLRYIDDINGNGKWDTGYYTLHRQPERVFYFSGSFNIRQNWQEEKNWDINEVPVPNQKPLEITKNKPTEKKKKRNENENQQNKNQNKNSNRLLPSSNSGSIQQNTRL